jgi:hypothetical protein
MACGLPVIASAIGGVTDMITPETGLIVPAGDPKALAEAMSLLAGDPALCERMGRAARRRYEELFSPSSVLPLVLDTYRRLAAGQQLRARDENLNYTAAIHPWSSCTVATESSDLPVRRPPTISLSTEGSARRADIHNV